MEEIWLGAWDALYEDTLDNGASEQEARKWADDHADDEAASALGDLIDYGRRQQKDHHNG